MKRHGAPASRTSGDSLAERNRYELSPTHGGVANRGLCDQAMKNRKSSVFGADDGYNNNHIHHKKPVHGDVVPACSRKVTSLDGGDASRQYELNKGRNHVDADFVKKIREGSFTFKDDGVLVEDRRTSRRFVHKNAP